MFPCYSSGRGHEGGETGFWLGDLSSKLVGWIKKIMHKGERKLLVTMRENNPNKLRLIMVSNLCKYLSISLSFPISNIIMVWELITIHPRFEPPPSQKG